MQIKAEMAQVCAVANTVDAKVDEYDSRLAAFDGLMEGYAASPNERDQSMAARMLRWKPGLFIGDGTAERQGEAWAGHSFLPEDNYELERSFRLPKGHARRDSVADPRCPRSPQRPLPRR